MGDKGGVSKRKEEGRCYRCGRTGCQVEVCPLKPARRPTPKEKVSKSGQGMVVREAAVDESEESPSDQDSGKE